MQQKLEKTYYKLLNKDDFKEIKQINKLINLFKKDIENELGFTFYETYATNMPNQVFDKRDINNIKNISETVVLRDKEGFYGIDENIQSTIDEYKIELEILHNLITRKEEIMNKEITVSEVLGEEIEIIRNKMGYGNVRNIILENQTRNKKVK